MTADGFDQAKLGVLRRAAQPDIVVYYDYERCVTILQEGEGWTQGRRSRGWKQMSCAHGWVKARPVLSIRIIHIYNTALAD